MKKSFFKLFTIIILSTLLSCNNNQKKTTENNQNKAKTVEIAQLNIPDFMEFGDKYVGKKISIEGLVEHVCKHTGKRMFIIGNTPEQRVQITAGKNIGTFDVALEGNKVKVQGIVKEKIVDEAYLLKWEQEIKSGNNSENFKIHYGKAGHDEESADEEVKENLQKINALRKQLKEKAVDHLSFYSIECESFEILK